MSAVNRRMTMAWVWPALVLLARLTTAEEPRRDAHGALAGSKALISDSEPPMETRSGGGFLPVLVWKFVKDAADASDLGRPQFLCSDTSLSVRLSLIRYSDLHLQDGRRLAWLQQGCDGSVGTVGPWLLLKLPYTSCHVTSQVSNGTWFHQLKLRYFDHLLRENMTAVVACEDPATWTLPAVSCRSTEVAVKLPQGSRLQKVKALGKDVVVGRVQTTTTPEPVLVQISTPADKDSMFEVIYLDSAGEMSTMLAACFGAARGDGRDRRRRALQHQDQWDWGVNPRHWHNVEPRQMVDNSSEYLDASDDGPSDEDDKELDGYEEDSDDELDEEQSDDEESDDANNTTANMTDAQTNSTIAAPTTTLTVEAEETLNSSMPVKPRLGRGLADMETSGDSEEDDDTFSPVGPRLGREMDDMEVSDDSENEEYDEEEYDGEDDYSDDADYEDSTMANITDAQSNATIAASNTTEEMLNTLPPVGPRLGRGMDDMEVSDDSENEEYDEEEYDGEDDYSDDADYEDSTMANITDAQSNATIAASNTTEEMLNTLPPVGPRLGRGMEASDLEFMDNDASGDEAYDDGSSGDDYYDEDSATANMFDAEMNALLPFEPRLWRGMDDLEASDDPEDMEEHEEDDDDDDDSEDDDYDSEDDDTFSPLEPRLGRGMDDMEASDPELMDDDASGDEASGDYDSSGDDELSDSSGEVSDD
ncbi:uncharacterized protein LOC111564359 [Amphiprion ocellaris]|uniref:uncharacterized protein LOC111564359 n=1 Tax=Amphiprion ocellaris TaxID=80972 RepID=UPI002410EFDD|nr:uncharacterized protein LOC111564359 [Amphiprion ocellaris]